MTLIGCDGRHARVLCADRATQIRNKPHAKVALAPPSQSTRAETSPPDLAHYRLARIPTKWIINHKLTLGDTMVKSSGPVSTQRFRDDVSFGAGRRLRPGTEVVNAGVAHCRRQTMKVSLISDDGQMKLIETSWPSSRARPSRHGHSTSYGQSAASSMG